MLGLNDQIQTNSGSNAGVGFAIPANTDARIANAIIAGNPVKHAYVGVELNSASTNGAQVTQVQPSSPGASAGLQTNDVITAVNGKSVSSTQGFIETVDNYAPGQTVTLTVKRGGQQQSIQLKLGTQAAVSVPVPERRLIAPNRRTLRKDSDCQGLAPWQSALRPSSAASSSARVPAP